MRIGLAFAGGGGKGAYQIGVWKAMEVFGYNAEIIAGTSVGALNAALYTQGSLEVGIKLWESINSSYVLSFEGENQLTELLNKKFNIGPEHLSHIPNFLKQKGIFSQSGLKRLISENIDFSKIRNSNIKFYATAHNKIREEIKYFHVNQYVDENIIKILLASSSLPIVFDDIEIEGEIYADGGGSILGSISNQLLEKKYAYDNNPIRPLYNEKLDLIIWVALDRGNILNYSLYPNTKILPIIPRQGLGGFINGTLDFSSKGARTRIEQGYEDASAIFRNIDNLLYNEAKYEELWGKIKSQDESLNLHFSKIDNSNQRQLEIKQFINRFNQNILDTKFNESDELILIESGSNSTLERNRALLNKINRKEVQDFIEDFVERNKDNTREFENNIIEALGYITPVKAVSENLKGRRFLKSFFDKFTNRTDNAVFSNDQNLALAQEATIQLINVLNKKNLCTLDFVATLNNKLNRAYYEIAELHTSIDTQYMQIYETLSLMFYKIKSKIIENSEKLEEHHNKILKLEWLSTVSVSTYCGVEYRNLSDSKKMVCLINDFYRVTGGKWSQKELLILKQAMLNLDIYEKQISIKDINQNLVSDKSLKLKLTEGLIGGEEGLYLGEYKNETGLCLQIPAFNFALEILYTLQSCGYKIIKTEDMDGIKQEHLINMERLKLLCNENNLSHEFIKEIDNIIIKIKDFKIKVPLIGIFSSGKSTLLNKYLQVQLLDYKVTPETALATELKYTDDEEKILINLENGEVRTYPIDSRDDIMKMYHEILYLELYVRSIALRQYKDLILVDMPGIDSNYKHHNKAIASYINKGCFYIICISAGDGISASLLSFLQQMNIYDEEKISFLVTKIDKIHPFEVQSQMNYIKEQLECLGFKNPIIEKAAAADEEIEGFKRILDNIDNKKDEILAAEINPSIALLVKKMEYSLRLLLNEGNNEHELEEKKSELKEKISSLQNKIKSEKTKSMAKIHNIAQDIANDTYSVLMQMKFTLISEIKAGVAIDDRVRGLVQNTYQISLKQRLQKLLKESANAINRYVSESIYSEVNVDNLVIFEGINIDKGIDSKIVAGIGIFIANIFLGPIGGVLAGLISGFLFDKSKEKQIEEQLTSAFEQIKHTIASNAPNIISKVMDCFFHELEKKTYEMQVQMEHDIKLLQDGIDYSKEEREKKNEGIQSALDEIKTLIN